MPASRRRPAGATPASPVRQPTHTSPVRHGDDQWLLAEIPVYRSTPAAYQRSIERRPRRYSVQVTAQERAQLPTGHVSRSVPQLWDYNEVAGWLQLFVVSVGMVKGYVWRKRTARRPNPGMPLLDLEGFGVHDLECLFLGQESSAEIYAAVRRELVALAGREFPSTYYLDLEAFDTIGPVLNWRVVLGFEPLSQRGWGLRDTAR